MIQLLPLQQTLIASVYYKKTQITPTSKDNIPQGIAINKLGRDYLYVSEKAKGISVYKKFTDDKTTNIIINNNNNFGNNHDMHTKQ